MSSELPRRMPALAWRKPAWVWTPLALLVAVGGPWLLLRYDGALAQTALIAGLCVYALALTSLGTSWMLRKPPRTRRAALAHVLAAGACVAIATPFVIAHIVASIGDADREASALSAAASVPLALTLGLPLSLLSGLAFTCAALQRQRPLGEEDRDVQPFQ